MLLLCIPFVLYTFGWVILASIVHKALYWGLSEFWVGWGVNWGLKGVCLVRNLGVLKGGVFRPVFGPPESGVDEAHLGPIHTNITKTGEKVGG